MSDHVPIPPREVFTPCLGINCQKKERCLRHKAAEECDDFYAPMIGHVCSSGDHLLFIPLQGCRRDDE